MIELKDSQIIDILPEALSKDPQIKALSYALGMAVKRVVEYADRTNIYSSVDTLPEYILDALALDLGTQHYDQALPVAEKRNLIKGTLSWYTRAGTPTAVKELVAALFGTGEVIEWFKDGGEPYTFKIRTEAPIGSDEIAEFSALIKNVINVRSRLSGVEISRNSAGNVYLAHALRGYSVNPVIKEGGI